jgi:hypothetical protein
MAINATAVSSARGAGSAPRAYAGTRAAGAALVLCALALASAPAAPAAGCPNEAIRSEQGTALPDCRAYELVSPAAKDGGEPLGPLSVNSLVPEPTRGKGARAASGGERLAWVSEYALPESSLTSTYAAGVPGLQYLSRRSGGGWLSESVIPPQSVQYGLGCPNYVGIVGWSPDLRRGVLADGIAQESLGSPGGHFFGEALECGHDEPLLAADQPPGFEERHKEGSQEGSQNLFLREDGGGSYRLLNPTPTSAPRPRPAHGNQEYFPVGFLAASDDLSQVVFEEELPLTPEAPGAPGWEGHDNLYEWSEGAGGAGTVSLVTILPGGEAVEGRLAGATRNDGGGQPEEIGGTPLSLLTPNVANFRHAVSADGSRIFFEAAGNLYVREDGASTFQVDASTVAGQSGGGGEFMAASASGRKVYFSADASRQLTADTLPGSGANLYQCDLPQGGGGCSSLTDLTPAAPQAGVLGVMGTSEGTKAEEEKRDPYVYLVATGALTAPVTGATPVAGQPNLYLRHGDATDFIATLDDSEAGKIPSQGPENGLPCTPATSKATEKRCTVTFGDSCDWTARGGCVFDYSRGNLISVQGGLTARVSANGRFLAFNSVKELTGYDNEDAASVLPREKIDDQIFLYDAATKQLRCASCNPDPGVRPTAPAAIREPAGPDDASYQKANYPQRNLSDAGQLFFDSQDALLSADTNGALDVYEYQAGQLQLISSGKSEVESFFLDASSDGSDVFFMTAQPLLGQDRDTAYDIYDARVGGGFPEADGPAPPCEGEAQCRAAAASPPAFPAPLSASFQGPGNQRQAGPAHHRKRRHHRRHRHRHHHKRGRPATAHLSATGAAAPAIGASQAESREAVEAGTAPHVVTEDATNVATTSAELHGKVYHEVVFNAPECVALGLICHNSTGATITDCVFEYGTSTAYDHTAPCEPPPPYDQTRQLAIVAAAISGLEPNTTYHFRLVAKNEAGEVGRGEDRALMTLGTYGMPTIDAESYRIARQGDGTFTATLSARINPHGYDTTCAAQIVSDAVYSEDNVEGQKGSGYAHAQTLPCAPGTIPAGFGDVDASATATGLRPGARYHFRFLAANSQNPPGDETEGPDRTLLTFAVEEFSFDPSRLEEEPPGGFTNPYIFGPPKAQDLRAGGHPYELNERLRLSTTPEGPWGLVPSPAPPSYAVVNPRDIVTTLPPGLIGNPQATPRCAEQELTHATCSGAAQVGVLRVETNRHQPGVPPPFYYELPLYNLVPPAGVAAQLGVPLIKPTNANAYVDAGLDAGSGYAVKAAALNASTVEGIIAVTATLWGVPHDPSHDNERICPKPIDKEVPTSLGGECPSDAELEADLKPFLRNPTSCAAPAQATLELDAWQGPGDFVGASAPYPQMERCDEVPFDPAIVLTPSTASADSPTGLHVDLHLPQPESLTEPGEADLRKAVVALPRGLDVNPGGADGLAACSQAQVDLHGSGPAQCPDAAKIGAVEVDTPLLERPLKGGVFVATPYDNPFRSLLAIYIAIDDPQTGLAVKLAGHVEADPTTGQLTTTFDENPQLPFEDFKLDFFAGPRAALKTPATCGTFTTATDLAPWSAPEGANATPSSSFAVSSGPNGSQCAASADREPHGPAFSAGTLTPQAGAYSPFVLHLARADGSQAIRGVSAALPPGLTGKLAGIPYCSKQAIVSAATRAGRYEAAHPDCPAASQVGTVTVGAGAGPKPLYVEGHAYLAGPYRGAPLSLAIVTPAVAGPFDLGTVVVRTALYVNPETAQIRAVSEPIPTILEGIPLDVRSIAVQMDKPNFTLNPTSCEPMAIAATALSALDQVAPLSNRFQVGGCAALPFAPRLALSLKGRGRRGGHPALKAVLTAQPGEANIASAQVTLPHSEFLDQGHIGTICTRIQFAEGSILGEKCPAASVYGFARAETPLLDQPLEGPVYLRSSSHELPDLVAALGGQIEVVLAGRVDAVHSRIRNTFEVVPDAPVSRFTLEMQGGAKGLLVNSTNLCRSTNRATVGFTAQNGKTDDYRPVVANSCKKGKAKKKKSKGHRKR